MDINYDFTKKKDEYKSTLSKNILPFWLKNGLDEEHGGYLTALDRKGDIIDTDKSIWVHGRFSWILATAYADVEQKQEWLDAASSGLDFLDKYGFDDDGRMYFRVTRDGRPVIKRIRYFFSELFAVSAMAAWCRGSGDNSRIKPARELLKKVLSYRNNPDILIPKFDPVVRPAKGMAVPMILLNTVQELRRADPGNTAEYNKLIDGFIDEIRGYLKPEYKAVLEQTGPNGELQDHFEGRLLTPGHAIEAAWFILSEARERNDKELTSLGCRMLDWMWEWGWDKKYGGIIYYRDVLNKPPSEYWHDMKFWWPQNEAAIATLMAWATTDDDKYLDWHSRLMNWIEELFPDKEYGEWFGYLHRDGRLSTDLKGNMYKGPFHVPRMYYRLWETLERAGY
ncbi:MAG: AGE family epimerase/isomerase [Spirochaetaceae bacterium]|nr:AGE family epimerase/isomerase [Spirochaetaceae bacterium]